MAKNSAEHQLDTGSPPASNTGAKTPPAALIDWLGFTAPDGTPIEGLLPGELDWVELPRGRLGYRRSLQSGHIRIDLDGQPGMGVHVELTGQGCREAEALGVVTSWPVFLGDIASRGMKVSRLDVALDDRSGLLSLDAIASAAHGGYWTSRWKAGHVRQPFGQCGDPHARTIYFGSSQSDARLRIYDKGLETGSAPAGGWIRCELQLRDDRAERMAAYLAAGDGELGEVAAVLRGYLDFKDPDDDNVRRDRRRSATWWLAFLGNVGRARLGSDPIVRTLEAARVWFRHQVAPTLALLLVAAGGDLAELLELARQGRQRWRAHHRAMLVGAVLAPG